MFEDSAAISLTVCWSVWATLAAVICNGGFSTRILFVLCSWSQWIVFFDLFAKMKRPQKSSFTCSSATCTQSFLSRLPLKASQLTWHLIVDFSYLAPVSVSFLFSVVSTGLNHPLNLEKLIRLVLPTPSRHIWMEFMHWPKQMQSHSLFQLSVSS